MGRKAVVTVGVGRLVGSQKYKKVQAALDCTTTTTTDGIWEVLDFANRQSIFLFSSCFRNYIQHVLRAQPKGL